MSPHRFAANWTAVIALAMAMACSGNDTTATDTATAADEAVEDSVESEDTSAETDGETPEDLVIVDMGPDADPCIIKPSAAGFQDNCDGTVTHVTTGRLWQQDDSMIANLTQARDYCRNLGLADKAGWQLPTIDELRELLIGCPNNGIQGSCPITHETCQGKNWDDPVCNSCEGCDMLQGPGTDGCYIDPAFTGNCVTLLSNTQVKAQQTGDLRTWYITLYDGRIDAPPPGSGNNFFVRCVRQQ